MSKESEEFKEYLKREWSGLHGLLFGDQPKVQRSIEPKVQLSDFEKAMNDVEKERMAFICREMFETYGDWYGKFDLVKRNFDDLWNWIISFEENTPNWYRDITAHRRSCQGISGLGYSFDLDIASRHGHAIRFMFPWGGFGGLGDERLMGLYNLLPAGPTENPYALFNRSSDTPDLFNMNKGAKLLSDRFNEANILITATDAKSNVNIIATSSQLVEYLETNTLVAMMGKLMVACNMNDLSRYASSTNKSPLLLLQG
jgi:hypothetical protein